MPHVYATEEARGKRMKIFLILTAFNKLKFIPAICFYYILKIRCV